MNEHPDEPAYRPYRSSGMDAGTRRLAIIAAAIGGVLLVVVGGWSLMGHREPGIQVIEPLPGPIRIKPANPGGLQVMGAEPPPSNADAGGPSLAPSPEKPDPAALQAELEQARKDAVPPPPAPLPASIPAGTVAGPKPAAPPIAAPVVAAPIAPVPAPAPAPAPPKIAPSGHVEVQLGALDSPALARTEWARLSHKVPALLSARSPLIAEVRSGEKTFFRLRTGGFASIAEASAFCGKIRIAGGACTVARF